MSEGTRPFISIVIPLYNKERYIRETLASIRAQTKQDYEVIVVDDGSVDAGPSLVELTRSEGMPIHLVRQANAGVSAARNAGISLARGEWTLCLDADDRFHPRMLEVIDAIATRHPRINMIATGYGLVVGDTLVDRDSTDAPVPAPFGLSPSWSPWLKRLGWKPPAHALDSEGLPHGIVDASTGAVDVDGLAVRIIDDLPGVWRGRPLLTVISTAVRTRVMQAHQPVFPVGETCGEDLSGLFKLNRFESLAYTPHRFVTYVRGISDSLSSMVQQEDAERFWTRLHQEFSGADVPEPRRQSVARFIAKLYVQRAVDLMEVGDRSGARRMLARVPSRYRTNWWLRVWLRALMPGSSTQPAEGQSWLPSPKPGPRRPTPDFVDSGTYGMPAREGRADGRDDSAAGTPLVSVVIKALNEEANIARAIESALEAIARLDDPRGGEVVVADSISSDRTVEVAARYPVGIVQLVRAEDRSCGAGAQLGYQHSRGEFVYLLDGDMRLAPDFLVQGVDFLRAHPQAGGVAGAHHEQNTESLEYAARHARRPDHMGSGSVTRLDGGGLYRRRAIEDAGYLSDRNLHSYEEVDLGTRLRACGWSLHRIDTHGVDHWGHAIAAAQLLKKRWKSGYMMGLGEALRGAAGHRSFWLLLKDVRELRLYAGILAWYAACVVLAFSSRVPIVVPIVLAVLPWFWIWARKRSMAAANYAVAGWAMNIAATLRGLVQKRQSPTRPLDSVRLK